MNSGIMADWSRSNFYDLQRLEPKFAEGMRTMNEQNLTAAVLAQIKADNPRVQAVVTSLVKHLHAFVREVEPSEAEWFAAIQFLTATGQKCDEKRQEFILLSDTLGVSMLVDAINHRRSSGTSTESTVLGPFHAPARQMALGDTIAHGPEAQRGEPCVVRGRVLDPAGQPIAGATLDVWQAADDGFYDVQPESNQPEMNLRGVFHAAADGSFWFRTIKPNYYPIPTDGPVGQLLLATGRHPMRPAHIHFMISAPGYERLVTHIFVAGDPYLSSDAVFGVKDSLVIDFTENHSTEEAANYGFQPPFCEVAYEFVLTPV
jgi:protocatechuate 3,4-dioxygenase beta subunit